MARSFGALNSTLATLGVTLSVAGLAAFAKSAIDAAANLDDLAEKTGASVEELSKLQQVAKISGTDFGVVETFLVKLNKALHETDEEAKGANRALSAIGLNAAELRTLDPAEAMRRIAVELTKFADSGGKTAAILALTGKSAAEALPFLKDLATETGITARVTAEQAAQAEELQKSIRRLTNEASQAAQAFARDFIPSLINTIEQLREGTKIAGGFLNAILLLGTINPFKTSGENIKSLGQSLDDLHAKRARMIEQGRSKWLPQIDAEIAKTQKQIEFSKLQQRQEALGLNAGRGRLDSKDLGPATLGTLDFKPKDSKAAKGAVDNRFENAIKGLEQEALKVQDLTKFEEIRAQALAGHYGKLSTDQLARLEQLAAEVDLNREDARVQKEADAAVLESNKRVQDAAKSEGDRLAQNKAALIALIDPVQKFREELEKVRELLDKGLITSEQATEAEFAIQSQIEDLQGLKEAVKDAGSFAQDLGLTFTSAFGKLITEGGKSSDVLVALAKDIGQLIFKLLVLEPIAKNIKTAFEGWNVGGGGGGGGGGWLESIFKMFGGGGDVMGGFATGTDFVPQTGPYMLHRGEQVIPAGNSGGVTVHQAINFSANTPAAVRDAVMSAAPRIAEMAKQAVFDSNLRGERV